MRRRKVKAIKALYSGTRFRSFFSNLVGFLNKRERGIPLHKQD